MITLNTKILTYGSFVLHENKWGKADEFDIAELLSLKKTVILRIWTYRRIKASFFFNQTTICGFLTVPHKLLLIFFLGSGLMINPLNGLVCGNGKPLHLSSVCLFSLFRFFKEWKIFWIFLFIFWFIYDSHTSQLKGEEQEHSSVLIPILFLIILHFIWTSWPKSGFTSCQHVAEGP